MKIAVAILLLLGLGAGGWKLYQWRNQPPEVTFLRATRGSIASEVATNGRVDPVESAQARAESSGRVERILIKLRQNVNAGDVLVELDTSSLRQDLETVRAKMEQVRAQIASLDTGKRTGKVDLETEIDQQSSRLKTAQDAYNKEVRAESLGIATREQVRLRKDDVDRIQDQITALNQRLAAFNEPSDRRPLEAQIPPLESERAAIELRIRQATIRAPISGAVFQFDLKPGAYLNPGDAVATIGRFDRMHVVVYVDEPDLGRVRLGLPVAITWDALPGRAWSGSVDRLPTQIQPLDSRQVGEVTCIINNPNLDLIPGANATVRIRTEVVEDAISIPKEAVFHMDTQAGVFLLAGDRLKWLPITEGVSNVTRVQVQELKEGDVIAQMTTDRTLTDGMQIRPLLPK